MQAQRFCVCRGPVEGTRAPRTLPRQRGRRPLRERVEPEARGPDAHRHRPFRSQGADGTVPARRQYLCAWPSFRCHTWICSPVTRVRRPRGKHSRAPGSSPVCPLGGQDKSEATTGCQAQGYSSLVHPQPFLVFILREGLTKLSRRDLTLQSSCLGLPKLDKAF